MSLAGAIICFGSAVFNAVTFRQPADQTNLVSKVKLA